MSGNAYRREGYDSESLFIEVGHYNKKKAGQGAEGDVFLSRKTEDGRIISVLSDGLGSGIKAGVLATLTATMAARFIAEDIPIRKAARIIMRTLPVCKERGISYATFTLVDIDSLNRVKIIEYDNPAYLLVRQSGQPVLLEPLKQVITINRTQRRHTMNRYESASDVGRGSDALLLQSPAVVHQPVSRLREALLQYSEFAACPGDRLVFFSDGVSQSGMGSKIFPLGWTVPRAQSFVLQKIIENPDISARELARQVVLQAEANDAYLSKDDITCAVIYFRRPRKLLLMTGPSIDPARDREMAALFAAFPGKRVLCGGTTASIISRELGRPVKVSLKNLDPGIPPASTMDGADLVTEGIITLGKVLELLENPAVSERYRSNPVTQLLDLLLDSDQIEFVVGTKINEAHQDPTMPVELEIRRNVVKRIAGILKEKYLKETQIRFI
ncbi:MAG: SpoIIE family protein phosphatase [Termitinemataceae bacterium]